MRKGDTILFEAPPSAVAYAAVGGKKEAEGPLADAFDMLIADTLCGEKTWEKAESDFARYCLEAALKKGRLQADALDAVFAGDLQCQCTASAYTMRGFDTPYLGLYGACSTMAEGFGLAACMVAGGHMQYAAAMSSSHFCAAERQFRTPLDYGGKRTPTAQWTVTGAGAAILAPAGGPPYVRAVTFGRVRDYNVTDINNMGAAMARPPVKRSCATSPIRAKNRSTLTPFSPGTWALWAARCCCSCSRRKVCRWKTIRTAACWYTTGTRRTFRRAGPARAAAPRFCAATCCPRCARAA